MKYYFALIVISLVALWPFFKKGYFESHDGEWMVIRFSAFHQTLVSGQIPVRFVDRLNNNYGYPVLNFLYPLPFYLAEIPKLAGFGFVDSIKIIFILSSIGSVLAMYWALIQIFDRRASMAGAIAYFFAPYRFVDLYVRGSLGENLAFVFAPLILGCTFKIAKGQKSFLPVLSVSTACLILSHNVIAVIFLPFLITSLFFLTKKERLPAFAAFLLGLLIAAFFWLPAIYDLQFVRLSQIKVSNIPDHLVSLQQLIIPNWGYGPTPSGQNSLSVQLGVVSIFAALTAAYLRITGKLKVPFVDFMLIASFLIALLMSKLSLPLWLYLPYIDVIQFPWRMLSLIVFMSALLAAFLINLFQQRTFLAGLIVFASIISTITYTKPRTFVDRGEGFYSTNEDSTTVQDEYLPLWVNEKPQSRADKKFEVNVGNAQIESTKIKPVNYQAMINTSEDSTIQVNTIYFPGHQVKVDGQKSKIDYQNKFGLINLELPKGRHEVIIKYGKTPVHFASELISAIALVVAGVLFYKLWRKQNF